MTDIAAIEMQRLDDEQSESLPTSNCEMRGTFPAKNLVHVHATESVEDKANYLADLAKQLDFLKTTRPPHELRVIGEAAVATESLNQTVRVRASSAVIKMRAMATQVRVTRAGGWMQNSLEATRFS